MVGGTVVVVVDVVVVGAAVVGAIVVGSVVVARRPLLLARAVSAGTWAEHDTASKQKVTSQTMCRKRKVTCSTVGARRVDWGSVVSYRLRRESGFCQRRVVIQPNRRHQMGC